MGVGGREAVGGKESESETETETEICFYYLMCTHKMIA